MIILIMLVIISILMIMFMISISKLKTNQQILQEDEEQIKYLEDVYKKKGQKFENNN